MARAIELYSLLRANINSTHKTRQLIEYFKVLTAVSTAVLPERPIGAPYIEPIRLDLIDSPLWQSHTSHCCVFIRNTL